MSKCKNLMKAKLKRNKEEFVHKMCKKVKGSFRPCTNCKGDKDE